MTWFGPSVPVIPGIRRWYETQRIFDFLISYLILNKQIVNPDSDFTLGTNGIPVPPQES